MYSGYLSVYMMYDGVPSVIDLNNRYRLYSVIHIDQCTLQYCIRLFNSVLKIFSVYSDILLLKYV